MIRQKIIIRRLLGLTAASIALSAPVLAGQNIAQLRGQWLAPQHIIPAGNVVAPQYLYARQNAQQYIGPQSIDQSVTCQAYRPCYAAPAQLQASLTHSLDIQQSPQNYQQGYPYGLNIRALPVAPVVPKEWGLPVVDMNQIRSRSYASYDPTTYDFGTAQITQESAPINVNADVSRNSYPHGLNFHSLPVAPVVPKEWGLPVIDMNQIRSCSHSNYDLAAYDSSNSQTNQVIIATNADASGYPHGLDIDSLPVAPVVPKEWNLPVVDMNQIRSRSYADHEPATYNYADAQTKQAASHAAVSGYPYGLKIHELAVAPVMPKEWGLPVVDMSQIQSHSYASQYIADSFDYQY